MAEWEKAQSLAVRWRTLEPTSLHATAGAVLTKQPDGSILASGKNPRPVRLHHRRRDRPDGITGLRLEVLPNEGLPNRGPGRAPDGNFVLTEIEVLAAPKADSKQVKPVKLQTPLADFSQEGYSVAEAIDGDRTNQGAGWAVSPTTGVTHWATFETAEPVGKPGGTVITVKIHHRFNAPEFTLGRFRLAVTKVPRPVALGITEEFRSILATVPELRTEDSAEHPSQLQPDHGCRVAKQAGGARRQQGPAAGRFRSSRRCAACSSKPSGRCPLDPYCSSCDTTWR